MYMHIYAFAYICICIYIYMHIHIYVYAYTCICIYICIYMYMHIYICVCIYMYMYMHIYIYIYIDIWIHKIHIIPLFPSKDSLECLEAWQIKNAAKFCVKVLTLQEGMTFWSQKIHWDVPQSFLNLKMMLFLHLDSIKLKNSQI